MAEQNTRVIPCATARKRLPRADGTILSIQLRLATRKGHYMVEWKEFEPPSTKVLSSHVSTSKKLRSALGHGFERDLPDVVADAVIALCNEGKVTIPPCPDINDTWADNVWTIHGAELSVHLEGERLCRITHKGQTLVST